jgi:hypothetical protein
MAFYNLKIVGLILDLKDHLKLVVNKSHSIPVSIKSILDFISLYD